MINIRGTLIVIAILHVAVSHVHSMSWSYSKALPDTSRALMYFRMGVQKFNSSDFQGAISDFSMVIKLEPSNSDALRWRGDAKLELKQFEQAIEDYNKAIAVKDRDFFSHWGRAQAKRFMKDLTGAKEDYYACSRINPSDFETFFWLGICDFDLENVDDAIKSFTSCIQLEPAYQDSYYDRGLLYGRKENFEKALKDFNTYLKLGGTSIGVYYLRGFTYFQLTSKNKTYADSAVVDLEQYVRSGDKTYQPFGVLGGAYGIKHDSVKSRENFRKAIENSPEDDSLTYELWGKTEFNFGNYLKTIEFMNKCLSLRKRPQAEFYHIRALAKVSLCDLTGAVEDFDLAIGLDSLDASIYESRLSSTVKTPKYYDMCMSDMTQLIRLATAPEKKAGFLSVRGLLEVKLGKTQDSEKDVNDAIVINSSNPIHYVVRGFIKAYNKEDKQSILEDYHKAEKLSKNFWPANLALSLLYREAGDLNKACKFMEKSVKYDAPLMDKIKDYLCGKGNEMSAEEVREQVRLYLTNYLMHRTLSAKTKRVNCPDGFK